MFYFRVYFKSIVLIIFYHALKYTYFHVLTTLEHM